MPDYPCRHCRNHYGCRQAGDLARRLLFAWVHDESFSCDDYDEAGFHGLEGVRA